jgi:hypothetical protein
MYGHGYARRMITSDKLFRIDSVVVETNRSKRWSGKCVSNVLEDILLFIRVYLLVASRVVRTLPFSYVKEWAYGDWVWVLLSKGGTDRVSRGYNSLYWLMEGHRQGYFCLTVFLLAQSLCHWGKGTSHINEHERMACAPDGNAPLDITL